MNDDLARRIQDARFTPVRLREGYDMSEVDDLLDELTAAVTAERPVQPLIAAARFTPVRLREGYDIAEVDRFLDEVAGFDMRGDGEASATVRSASRRQEPQPSVIQEQRGMLARIFGRRS